MATLTNMALIECNDANTPYWYDATSAINGFCLKKVLPRKTMNERLARKQYPHSEIVQSRQAIINDKSIELVLVSCPAKEDLSLIGEVLESGKSVRII